MNRPSLPVALPDDVRAAIAAGNQIDAIRLLRQHSGLGLAEAKAAVDSAKVARSASSPVEYGWELPREAKTALDQGKLLQALRVLRAAQGIGLKDAKAIVDVARGESVRPVGRLRSGLAPGEVPRSPINAGLVITVLLVVAAVIWLMRAL